VFGSHLVIVRSSHLVPEIQAEASRVKYIRDSYRGGTCDKNLCKYQMNRDSAEHFLLLLSFQRCQQSIVWCCYWSFSRYIYYT